MVGWEYGAGGSRGQGGEGTSVVCGCGVGEPGAGGSRG